MVCINASMICDGIVHCNDGDDEGEHCSHLTGETEDDCSGEDYQSSDMNLHTTEFSSFENLK